MYTAAPPDPLPPDESVGPLLLILTYVLTGFAIVTTCLRFWVRWARRKLGWDDYTIGLTTLLAIARMAIQVVQVQHGDGRHRWYISSEDYKYSNKLGLIAQMLLFATICLVKVSICLLIMRIKNTPTLNRLMYTVMASLFITNFGCIIIELAECTPMKKYWDEDSSGTCWDAKVRIYFIYVTIAISIVTDLICSLLPLALVWKVNISLQKKIQVSALMSLGLLATSFAIVRASSLGLKTDDLSWSYAIAAIWSNLELFLGIIAANLALGRSLYTFFRDEARLCSSRNNPGYGSGNSESDHSRNINNYDETYKMPSLNHWRESMPASEASDIPLQPIATSSSEKEIYTRH